jgi:hypothetical protein
MTPYLVRLFGSLSALALMACAATPPLQGPPTDPQMLYDEVTQPHREAPPLQPRALPVGPEAPYTPIMQPPVVQRVWVPDHLNADGDLVSGHWVYLLLEPSRWFLETYPAASTSALRVPLAPPTTSAPPAAPEAGTSRAPGGQMPTSTLRVPHTPSTPPATLSVPRQPETASPAAVPATVSLSADQIRALQRQLARAGWSPGPIDGTLGLRTRQALRRAQRAMGLLVTGEPDIATLTAVQRHLTGTAREETP